MHKNLLMILGCFLMTSCLAQSQVQGKYDSAKEACQAVAATSVAGANITGGARDGALKSAFGACMKRNGFQFSTAKPAPVNANPQPDPVASVARPVTRAQPQPNPAATTAASTTSAPAPAAAQPAFAPLPSNAATYQPVAQPARNFPARQ